MDYRPHEVQQRIDGLMYTSSKLPASEAILAGPRIVRLLGRGMLVKVLDGSIWNLAAGLMVDPSSAENEEQAASLGEVRTKSAANAGYILESIAERADAVGLEDLAMRLLAGTRCERLRPAGEGGHVASTKETFDAHFAGEYLHLLKVLAFAVRHNFAGPTLGLPLTSGSPGTPTATSPSTKASAPSTSTHASST